MNLMNLLVGGFLFDVDRFALCLRINPPLRIDRFADVDLDWG
jgi:hypothetical protein